MKKKKITYGVQGMMEYHAVVNVGKAKMKVPFTDGSATSFGCTPATFTTDNLIVQLSIENSSDYKRGRIFKYREYEMDEEVDVASNLQPVQERAMEEELHRSAEDVEDGGEGAGASSVVFRTNDDAKEYLEVHYGMNRSKLLKRADIVSAGKTVGLEIRFE